jgi:uncharacterized membrane protein YdjX (TVP38/TMEM64 family)
MKKTIGLGALVLICFSLVLYFLIYHSNIYLTLLDRQKLAEYIKSYGNFSPFIFVALQIFQVLFAPIPGEVTGFIGGFLYGNLFGILYSTIGLGVGSWLAFVFARWAGQPLVEQVVSYKTLQRYDYLMAHQGTWIAFLLFLIPGFPKDYMCYILGLGHMDLKTFLIISTAGRFLGTVILTMQGHLVREKNYWVLGIVIGISLMAVLIAYLFRKKLEVYLKKHHKLGTFSKIKKPK